MRVIKALYRFFASIAMRWWSFWSTLRFRKCERNSRFVEERDVVKSLYDIEKLAMRVYNVFEYKKDGADQLWDAITPPPQNYLNYLNGKVEDDCDGFHSTVFHCVKNSNIGRCFLLSVTGPKSGHCVFIFKFNDDMWRVLDYTNLYDGHLDILDAVNEYNNSYREIYGGEAWYNALIDFDYDKGKFKYISLSDFKR